MCLFKPLSLFLFLLPEAEHLPRPSVQQEESLRATFSRCLQRALALVDTWGCSKRRERQLKNSTSSEPRPLCPSEELQTVAAVLPVGKGLPLKPKQSLKLTRAATSLSFFNFSKMRSLTQILTKCFVLESSEMRFVSNVKICETLNWIELSELKTFSNF